jgi:hypothetical protein
VEEERRGEEMSWRKTMKERKQRGCFKDKCMDALARCLEELL